MIIIEYTITSGYLPNTVQLIDSGSSVYATNVHTIYESGSFEDLPDDVYTINFLDGYGRICEQTGPLQVTTTTTSTSSTTTTTTTAVPCFGYLYNWYAVDDSRELTSSADWSVPTKTETSTLRVYSGGSTLAGLKLKEIGTTRWDDVSGDRKSVV